MVVAHSTETVLSSPCSRKLRPSPGSNPRGPCPPSDLASISQHCARLGAEDRSDLEATLRPDVQSEFDARFLAEHLAKQPWILFAPMGVVLEQWLVDEELHQLLFLQVYEAAFPARFEDLQSDLAQRHQDVAFGPLKHLMEDEFEVLCLMAYNELTTIKALPGALAAVLQTRPEHGAVTALGHPR
ncbi:MAG: hypothetical protein ACI9X4_000027 [Glaciecola sp.]|jgi:hypothetical protein